jgi:uncharacterized protein (DUF58 family)
VDEINVYVKESQAKNRRRARRLVRDSLRDGTVPGIQEVARARGMVIRERENSIFSDAWMLVSILALALGLVANRNAAMMAVGIGLGLIALVSTLWKRASLIGVSYERSFDRTHVFPGEPVTMVVTINNRKPLPLTWLQFRDEAPVAPTERGELAVLASEVAGRYSLQNTLSMRGFEQSSRSATFRFSKRGFYKFGPVRYQSGDIFTLFTIEREYRDIDNLIVYPRLWPLDTLDLPAKEMFGDLNVRRSLFTDPVRTRGIRNYQPQDRFRDIHWKASARRGELQTKVYEPTSGMSIVTFLNVATFEKHWMGFEPEMLERAVSVTASIASYAAEQKWAIGVYANGSVPGSDQPIRVAPGRAPDQLMRILEGLAAVTEFATGSIQNLMHHESRRLPWATTFVLVTAVVNENMLVTLIRLKEAGRRITLISLAAEPPPREVKGLLIYHVPPSLSAFDIEIRTRTATETALSSIPGPIETTQDFYDSPSSD